MNNTITKVQGKVIEILKGKGYEAEVAETVKNGVTLKGVIIRSGSVAPVAWIDERYTAERIAEGLIAGLSQSFDIKAIEDFANIKGNLRTYLTRAESADVVTEDLIGNIKIGVRVYIATYEDGGERASAKVTRGLLQKWGKTFSEILEVAKANTANMAVYKPMFEMIKSMIPAEDFDDMLNRNDPVSVLTTQDGQNGASLIANKGILDKIHDTKGDYYIIPSSIHEVIIVPCSFASADMLRPLIAEVNESVVSPEEVLSNELFKYDGKAVIVAYTGNMAS